MKHWHETAAVLARASELAARGVPTALATVIRLAGSGYRRPGAKLLISNENSEATWLGGVSGGCLEADVRAVALAALADGAPRVRRYATRADDADPFSLGLGCDGTVEVLVRPLAAEDEPALVAARRLLEGEAAFAIGTRVDGEEAGRSVIAAGADGADDGGGLADEARAAAAEALMTGRSVLCEAPGGRVFVDVLAPPPRLVVVGAGDDAIPLVRCAAAVGLRVTLVDHRPAYATAARFPAARRVVVGGPEEGLAGLPAGAPTAAVLMTHALARDHAWLPRLLATDVAYIGILGPRARARALLEIAGGDAGGRVFGPVGLDVGADGPEEIAVSVVAEVLAVLRGRPGGHLRAGSGPIHARVVAAGRGGRRGA